MKKILIVVGSLGLGGIEKLVADYSDCLKNADCQLYYVVFDGSGNAYEGRVLNNGAKIVRIPRPNNRSIFYKNICSILRRYGPFDIVHSHILFSSGLVMKAAYKNSIKERIAHSHDNLSFVKKSIFTRMYYSLMRRYLNKYSTKRVACSRDAGVYLFGKTFADEDGLIIKNKIDIGKFAFNKKERDAIRKKYHIDNDELLIGNIGRIEDQKNQKLIVDIVASKGINGKKIGAMIIGDGSKRNELEKYIEEKMAKRIRLLGELNNPEDFMSAFDSFVFPSIHEGFGIVLVEAQANGLPCFAPQKIVPIEAKVLDNFMFIDYDRKDDAELWASAVIKCQGRINESEAAERLRKAGYSIDDLSKDLIELYGLEEKEPC